MFVVKKSKLHKPFALRECKVMIIEPKDIKNTGEEVSDFTSANDVWI